MAVDPLAHAERRNDGSAQDSTAGDVLEAINFIAVSKSHQNRAGDGVADDLSGATAVLRIDWKHLVLIRLVCFSLRGQWSISALLCASLESVNG